MFSNSESAESLLANMVIHYYFCLVANKLKPPQKQQRVNQKKK
jgi:hypothetical protein